MTGRAHDRLRQTGETALIKLVQLVFMGQSLEHESLPAQAVPNEENVLDSKMKPALEQIRSSEIELVLKVQIEYISTVPFEQELITHAHSIAIRATLGPPTRLVTQPHSVQ